MKHLLDAELAEDFDALPQMDIWEDLPKARQLIAKARSEMLAQLPIVENIHSTDCMAEAQGSLAVPVRVYRPTNQIQTLPALLWVHGGGYCLGSVAQDDYIVRRLVEAIGAVVVSVDYRLAPEHPYPVPLDDCYCALQWLFNNAEVLSVDETRIGIGGISAGAGLAAGLALLARDRGQFNVIFQALLCPMIDDRSVTASSYMVTDLRVWNRNSNINGWNAYLGRDPESADNAPSLYAAPSRAENLVGLPPAYIAVGSVDAFIDENTDYALRLNDAGVETQFEVFKGGYHAFEFNMPDAQISKRARDCHYQAIRRGLFG